LVFLLEFFFLGHVSGCFFSVNNGDMKMSEHIKSISWIMVFEWA
jgi:hypothetical protein